MSRDLGLFYAYRVISRAYFHLPVLFVYLTMHGSSFAGADCLLAIYGLSVLVAVPLGGILEARMPAKWVLVISEGVKMTGLLTLAASSHLAVVVVAQVINGAGYAVGAGGPEASLLRSLAGSAAGAQRVQDTTQSWMFASVLVAGVAGAAVYASDPALVFVLTAGASLCALLAVGTISDRRPPTVTPPVPPTAHLLSESPAPGFGVQAASSWAFYYVSVRGVVLASYVGFLPFLLHERINVGTGYFGLILGVFSVMAFLSARYINVMATRLGDAAATGLTLVGVACSLCALALAQTVGLAVCAIAVLGTCIGGVRPLTMAAIGRTVPERGAASTIIARMERQYGLANGGILVVGGLFGSQFGFSALMFALACMTLGTWLLLSARQSRDAAYA